MATKHGTVETYKEIMEASAANVASAKVTMLEAMAIQIARDDKKGREEKVTDAQGVVDLQTDMDILNTDFHQTALAKLSDILRS
jgi:hypothetical protein